MSSLLDVARSTFGLFLLLTILLTIWLVSQIWDIRSRRRVSTVWLGMVWTLVAGWSAIGFVQQLDDFHALSAEHICSSHVRAISQAVQMYSADWDQVLPEAAQWSSGKTTLSSPYTNPEVWRCPAAEGGVSYAYNRRIGGLSLSHIVNLSDLVLLQETDTCGWVSGGTSHCLPVAPRHLGRDYFALGDGQVRSLLRGGPTVLAWQNSER